jgi:altronate dehydratase
VPASELTVALQCGGSDGYSGVSANPRWVRRAICWFAMAAPSSSETPET